MPVPRRAVAVSALALAALAALTLVPPAAAVSEGPCVASIAGENVGPREVGAFGDPIVVSNDRPVSVTMSADRPITRLKVELEFAGIRWTVHDRPSTGTSWASEVPVDDYAEYGLGLYKVIGTGTGPGIDCSGAALVDVQGDDALAALATPAGLIGLALALLGALGALALALRVGQSRVSPIATALLGAVFGLGIVILLQQFAVAYPTFWLTFGIMAIAAVVGFAIGLFGIAGSQADARSSPVR
jgi:hypothetical protein